MVDVDRDSPDIRLQAAQAASEANAHILALEALLGGREDREIGFFCECGCLGVITMTSRTELSFTGVTQPS
jgi:hypothetical protein